MPIFIILFFSAICYYLAKKRIIYLATHYQKKPRSLPEYYGLNIAMWNLLISISVIVFFSIFKQLGFVVNNTYIYLTIIGVFVVILIYILAALKSRFRAQLYFELTVKWLLNIAALLSFLLTIAIVFTILFESIKFFNLIPIEQFLLGLKWSPQSADYSDEPVFGVIPVLVGTALITAIAMFVAIPLGLLSAIYLSEYAKRTTRNIIKPILELLAGIPTIIYGYFAALTVGPLIRNIGEFLGLDVSTESALAAGLVMGIMIIPFILSFSEDALAAVPQSLRDGALALGSTKAEMVIKVLIPAASSGIISSILLAISRAIGETMIVTMAAGINARLTFNPLESVSSFTAQIVTLLVGDQEFDSPKTLAAFALALTLFIITLFLNIGAAIAIKRQKRHRLS
ncbi:MAG: phosphate ABC transporter permease subunit PstC [Rickettsiales bacterium]